MTCLYFKVDTLLSIHHWYHKVTIVWAALTHSDETKAIEIIIEKEVLIKMNPTLGSTLKESLSHLELQKTILRWKVLINSFFCFILKIVVQVARWTTDLPQKVRYYNFSHKLSLSKLSKNKNSIYFSFINVFSDIHQELFFKRRYI